MLCLIPLEFGNPVQIGAWLTEGLEANHYIQENPQEKPLHYLFVNAEQQWFYGIDGCWLLKPAWLRLQCAKLDMIVLDATLGKLYNDYRIFEHNTFDMVKEMVSAFRNAGIFKEKARIVLTHLSMHENPPHDLLVSEVEAMGFILACDGLEIEF